MIKKYLKLTKEQKARGVVFSSEFKPSGIRHEITLKEQRDNPKETELKMKRLKDDRFFRNWGHDSNGEAIHEIRSI